MSTAERPTGVVVVVTTLDDESAADALALLVVDERLAACAQVGGPVRSVYRWQGSVERSVEWTVTMKTSSTTLPALLDRVRTAHSYETPELVVTAVVDGDADYLAWVIDNTR